MSLDKITSELNKVAVELKTAAVQKGVTVRRKGEFFGLVLRWNLGRNLLLQELEGVEDEIKKDANSILKVVRASLRSIGFKAGRPYPIILGVDNGSMVAEWRGSISNSRRKSWPLEELDQALRDAIRSEGYSEDGFTSTY